MKRDMDLIRRILLEIEKDDGDHNSLLQIEIDDYSDHFVNYHLKLLYEANYIEAMTFKGDNQSFYTPQCLTWQGHDFLNSIREESIWRKMKNNIDDLSNLPVKSVFDIGVKLTSEYTMSKIGLK